MRIGKNWISGADTRSLANPQAVSNSPEYDTDFKYKFNRNGLLESQGLKPTNKVELESVSLVVDHGYFYVASKEMFIYGDKMVDIINPEHVHEVPIHIYIALYGSATGTPLGVASGMSSGYAKFRLTGIPTLMTPMVVSELKDEGIVYPKTIEVTKRLNEVDRRTLTFLKNRVTALDEPIADIFEVDSIRKLNDTKSDPIDPRMYAYDHFSNTLYVAAPIGPSAIEYETSCDGRVDLGKNFSPLQTGKYSGTVVLSPGSELNTGTVVTARRASILSAKGSRFFINLPEGVSAYLSVQTIYTDKSGKEIPYVALENNDVYCVALMEAASEPVYIGSLLVGQTDEEGLAILPIAGLTSEGLHGEMLLTEKRAVNIVPSPILLTAATIRIKAEEANVRTILGEIIVPMKSPSDATVATYSPRVAYGVAARKRTITISGGYRWFDAQLQELLATSVSGSESENQYYSLALDYTDRTAVKVTFTSSQKPRVFLVDTMSAKVMQEQGGDFYGL